MTNEQELTQALRDVLLATNPVMEDLHAGVGTSNSLRLHLDAMLGHARATLVSHTVKAVERVLETYDRDASARMLAQDIRAALDGKS